MGSNVFLKDDKKPGVFRVYKRHAKMLGAITNDTPIYFYAGKGGLVSRYPYLLGTDDCLIIGTPGKMLKPITVLPYRSISSCTVVPGGLGKIKINFGIVGSAPVEYAPGFLRQQDAQRICNIILEKSQPATHQTVVQGNNSLAEIEKLADLKSKGLVTEEEFQLKKKQLLNL